VLLCDFYPLYDFQLHTCQPAISPAAAAAYHEQESRSHNTSHHDLSGSHEFRTRAQPAIKEFILAIWIFSLLCEEFRQVSSIVLVNLLFISILS
jgi:hypothetical protein